MLVGCQSEVDKCVDSQLAAWKAKEKRKNEQITKYENEKKEIARTNDEREFTLAEAIGLVPSLDKRTEAEVSAEERIFCLSIVNKK